MARYKLIIAYDGSRFSGWQAQKNAKTVAGTLNEVLSMLYQQDINVYGSGRTDSGVHAIGQVAHCDIDAMPSKEEIQSKLPYGIHIRSLEKTDNRFHARHHAKARSYVYQLSNIKPLFVSKYVWTVEKNLSLPILRQGLEKIKGFHDFASFSAEKDETVSTKVHILDSSYKAYDDAIVLRFVGSHFLRSMIRRVVGTLVALSTDELSLPEFEQCIDTFSLLPSRLTAPPDGLFLEKVWYNSEIEISETIEPPLISSWKNTIR
jgi:tRNA pseudouridine38-40 synthase